jgi:hypothetical protein
MKNTLQTIIISNTDIVTMLVVKQRRVNLKSSILRQQNRLCQNTCSYFETNFKKKDGMKIIQDEILSAAKTVVSLL